MIFLFFIPILQMRWPILNLNSWSNWLCQVFALILGAWKEIS